MRSRLAVGESNVLDAALLSRYPGVRPLEAQKYLCKKRPQVSPNVWKRRVVFDFWDTLPQEDEDRKETLSLEERITATQEHEEEPATELTDGEATEDNNKKEL